MSEIKRVGLIGVGLMGHGIGKNILKNGYSLSVLAHRNRAPVDSLVSMGATEVETAAAAAEESDVVILCVTGSSQVEDAMYRKDGLLEGVHEGLVVADCTTAEPHSTEKVAADVEARGGFFVDIPITRTPKEAEEGKLALMTGGDPEVLARIRPVLNCFADTVVYAGAVGAGHKLKLINNFLALGTAALVAEGISAASRAGVDMQALNDVVTAGGANSVMFERLIKVPLANDDSALQFCIENAKKDLRYYTGMTKDMSYTSFMAETAHQLFVLADNLGHGKKFVPRMIDMFGSINSMAEQND